MITDTICPTPNCHRPANPGDNLCAGCRSDANLVHAVADAARQYLDRRPHPAPAPIGELTAILFELSAASPQRRRNVPDVPLPGPGRRPRPVCNAERDKLARSVSR